MRHPDGFDVPPLLVMFWSTRNRDINMSGSVRRRNQFSIVAGILAACGAAEGASADALTVLARTGMTSPYGGGTVHSRLVAGSVELTRPQIGASGDVCFFSILSGGDVTSGDALTVFCGNASVISPIWRRATQATGLPAGVLFGGLYGLQMSSGGDITYIASLAGPNVQSGVNDRGVWAGNSAGASCIARDGTPLSLTGYPSASMRWLTSSKVTEAETLGPVVITGSIDGTGLGSGVQCVLQQTGDGFNPAMMANTQLPGAAAGTMILVMVPIVGPIAINAYQTTLTGPAVGTVMINGVPIVTDKAITAGMGSQLRTIARSGSPVPTEAAGVAYSMVWGGSARMSVNGAGSVTYSASLGGPGIAVGNNWGIWLDRNGQLSRISRLTDASPVAGTTIGDFGLMSGASFVKLTENDAVLYTAMIMGAGANSTNNGTIIHSHNGVRRLVARGGVEMASLPSGVKIQNSNFGLGARVGTSGHVALAAKLEGPGVNSASDAAVFLWAPDQEPGLRLVCREGDQLGNYRIATLSQTGVDLHVNSQGQAVFTATVVDVNDSMMTPRTAIIAGEPERSAWVVAVEGGSLSLPTGSVQLRKVRMGTTGAFNDSGDVVFVIDAGTVSVPDEAVIVARLSAPSNPSPCPADYDGSGALTTQDIFSFLSSWFQGNADYDHSGATEVVDIFVFLADWYRGCE